MAKTRRSVDGLSSARKGQYFEKPVMEVIDGGEDHGNPPTYGEQGEREQQEEVNVPNSPTIYLFRPNSLMGRLMEAEESLERVLDFLVELYLLFMTAVFGKILLITSVVLPIAMLVMGTMKLFECPEMVEIPIFLLVGGIIGMIGVICYLILGVEAWPWLDWDEYKFRPIDSPRLCLVVTWLGYGSIWVSGIKEPNYDPEKGLYCDKALYTFTYWIIACLYRILGLFVTCVLFIIAARGTLALKRSLLMRYDNVEICGSEWEARKLILRKSSFRRFRINSQLRVLLNDDADSSRRTMKC